MGRPRLFDYEFEVTYEFTQRGPIWEIADWPGVRSASTHTLCGTSNWLRARATRPALIRLARAYSLNDDEDVRNISHLGRAITVDGVTGYVTDFGVSSDGGPTYVVTLPDGRFECFAGMPPEPEQDAC